MAGRAARPPHSTAKSDCLFCLIAAITLVVWMFPRYRLFDNSLPYVPVGALAFLLQQPSQAGPPMKLADAPLQQAIQRLAVS